ncbi:MAG: RNA methyltransferase [Alphaproteobacteria bacterium]|nr:RNA methyltransferase [Alphaproteobacteria bacterium]HCQ70961.1 16S rRNA (uracil(1498)-N(3))-methyltransferase [Rhodospirillaceae bacterium]|tara:strand:- start:90400 stop:91137 length:738 start_codon:yes stop_codon:yes gene_type:complete
MTDDTYFKLPRLYSENSLVIQEDISLPKDQAHYLKNVMRRAQGDQIRLFNGRDGEVLGEIIALGKKDADVRLMAQIKPQIEPAGRVHLLFAPLAKQRMDMVIEKAVELGVSDLHPVLTHRTEHRKVNMARLQAQIIEASEQSERLSLPMLHEPAALYDVCARWSDQGHPEMQWCCERDRIERKALGYQQADDQAFLVGPVGGFDDEEIAFLSQQPCIQPISLGANVLRAETASILCLSAYCLGRI